MPLRQGSVAQRLVARHTPVAIPAKDESRKSEEKALRAFIDDVAFEKWFSVVEEIVKRYRRVALVELHVDDAQRLDAAFAVKVIGGLLKETYIRAGVEIPDAVREIFE